MASENKKRKGKNGHLYGLGLKSDKKVKRLLFFTKRDRKRNNQIRKEDEE